MKCNRKCIEETSCIILILSIGILCCCTKKIEQKEGVKSLKDTVQIKTDHAIQETDKINQEDTRAELVNYANETISKNFIDINHDGIEETVNIVLDSGFYYNDTDLWHGAGRKWCGQFSVRVYGDDKLLSEVNINGCINDTPIEMCFYAPSFEIPFYDYNHDNQYDFLLGQYFSSNGFEYYPFTITAEGYVKRLFIKDRTAFFAMGLNTNLFDLDENGYVMVNYYDGLHTTEYFRWNDNENLFEWVKKEAMNGDELIEIYNPIFEDE